MRAVLLLRRRVVVAADAFVEAVIWQVPRPVPSSAHRFKYRLAYVVGGRCVVRYDNERGKGTTGIPRLRKRPTRSRRRTD